MLTLRPKGTKTMEEKTKAVIIMLVTLYASYKLYMLGEFLINANS